ncbi:uncharacterized protein [Dipodomys merriami]|uniref:uncharacterized protein n=1 Tax=Dipodomys merriami TaxID=94247 RepID=UPI003855A7E3
MCMMTHGTLLRGVEYQAPAPLHSYGSLDHMEALCSSQEALCSSQEALPVTRCFVAGWHPYLDLLSLDWLHTPSPYGCKCGLLMPIWSCSTGCFPMQQLLQLLSPVVFRPDQPRPAENRMLLWTTEDSYGNVWKIWMMTHGTSSQGFGYQALAPLRSHRSLGPMEALCSSQEALPVTRPAPLLHCSTTCWQSLAAHGPMGLPMEMPTPALPFRLHHLEPTDAEASAAGPAPAPAVLTSADFSPPMPLARPTASMTNAPSSQRPLHTMPQ